MMVYNDSSEFSSVNSNKLNSLQKLVEDLVINKVSLENIKNEVLNKKYLKVLEQEISMVSQIQDTVKEMIKVKMANVYSLIINMVNKYSKELSREINLILEGEEEKIDCSVFDLVYEVLSFLIKSIIDDSSTKIKVKTITDTKNLTITVESNSKTINLDKICKTLKKEYLNIVSINKDKNITIVIPVTSSITKAQLVSVGDQTYAIPLEFIETIINKDAIEIRNTNDMQMVVYMDKVIPIIKVREKLNISGSDEYSKCILVIKVDNHEAALLVDDTLDQTDVVIRQKPMVISDVLEFSGTTILGDGIVTLVLDVTSLIVKR